MSIIQFIRILKKHIWLLIAAPIILAFMVYWLTSNQPKSYESKVTFYTGIASGYTVDSDNSGKVDYNATQIAFDNFINILNSRKTLEDVAIRLFATHLLMDEADPLYISQKNFRKFQKMVPDEVKELAVDDDLEATVTNLLKYKRPVDSNFIYGLLNYHHPHYSVDAISETKAKRLNNSDLIEVSYQSDDPGICRLTLKLLTETFTANYKAVKANRTDEVIEYFEKELEKASKKLHKAENKLLQFNQGNDIINYYEQTKFIADQKEKLDVEVQHVKMNRASAKAAIEKLESQLSSMDQLKLRSQSIINIRDSLSNLNSRAALLETTTSAEDTASMKKLARLQANIAELESRLRSKVNELHALSSTKEGVNKKEILSAWLKKVIEYEGIKGSLEVLKQRQADFLKRYKTFAPLGAHLKRIERKISVSEREYLSILHSLGQARLKQQNIKLQSNVKVLSDPYFPINPLPSKRKMLIIAAALVGFILVLFIILVMEYFDSTLRFPERAEKQTGIPVVTVYPRIIRKNKNINFTHIKDRLASILMFDLQKRTLQSTASEPRLILFYSNQKREGKTLIIRHLVSKLHEYNIDTLYINHQNENPSGIEGERLNNEISMDISNLHHVDSRQELLTSLLEGREQKPSFVFVELPGIIPVEYPMALPRFADFSYIVARANRLWNKADVNAQNNIDELLQQKPRMILNGTELETVETFLGELPKKRSRMTRIMKRVLRLQFYSRYKI